MVVMPTARWPAAFSKWQQQNWQQLLGIHKAFTTSALCIAQVIALDYLSLDKYES